MHNQNKDNLISSFQVIISLKKFSPYFICWNFTILLNNNGYGEYCCTNSL